MNNTSWTNKERRHDQHRRTSQGSWGSCSPPDSGKTIIFQAKAKFFVQKPATKMKSMYLLYLLNEKNRIHSVERDKVPEIWDFY